MFLSYSRFLSRCTRSARKYPAILNILKLHSQSQETLLCIHEQSYFHWIPHSTLTYHKVTLCFYDHHIHNDWPIRSVKFWFKEGHSCLQSIWMINRVFTEDPMRDTQVALSRWLGIHRSNPNSGSNNKVMLSVLFDMWSNVSTLLQARQ